MDEFKVCACGNVFSSHDWQCHDCSRREMLNIASHTPTFEQLKEDISRAADRVLARGHLAGLKEAIESAKIFLISCESACVGDMATSQVMYRAAAHVDDLVTRAALLEKQIECGG